MGEEFVGRFSSMMWVLYPVAVVKAVGALGPLWLQARAWWPRPRPVRLLFWVGAVVLLAWGGLTTLFSNLVLFSVIRPDGGYDRDAMIGHGWIWDPLFVVWGVGLLVGLMRTRPTSND